MTIDRALGISHEQEEWLRQQTKFEAQIRSGLDELERGDAIPEDQLDGGRDLAMPLTSHG